MNDKSIERLSKNEHISGLNVTDLGKHRNGESKCKSCMRGKQKRGSFKSSDSIAKQRLELIHSDLCGPFESSINEERYFITFTDDYFRKLWVFLIKNKAETQRIVVEWIAAVEKETGLDVKELRTDNGSEYLGNLAEYCTRRGIRRSTSTPYTPEQNGVAERANGLILNCVRAMRVQKSSMLPRSLWAELVKTAAYLLNRRPAKKIQYQIPEVLWRGEECVLEMLHLKRIGCVAYVLIPSKRRDSKLDLRSIKCILVGYDQESKAYRCWQPGRNRIHRTSNVDFDKNAEMDLSTYYPTENVIEMPESSQMQVQEASQIQEARISLDPEFDRADQENWHRHCHSTRFQTRIQEEDEETVDDEEEVEADEEVSQNSESVRDQLTNKDDDGDEEEEGSSQDEDRWGNVRSSFRSPTPAVSIISNNDIHREPEPRITSLQDEDTIVIADDVNRTPARRTTLWTLMAIHSMDLEEPKSYEDAVNGPNGTHWRTAIKSELVSLQENNVWTTVSMKDIPKASNLVDSKWVFKIKWKADGTLDRFKAQLVARGFTQSEGIDYHEIFAPVLRLTTLRILLSIAVQKGYKIHQMDIVTAYLYARLKEKVYMKMPKGLEVDSESSRLGLLLNKCLYGLKQSAMEWYRELLTTLMDLGLRPLEEDQSLFINKEQEIYVAVYVDDLIIVAESLVKIDSVKDGIASKFKMKDLGEARFILGIEILR